MESQPLIKGQLGLMDTICLGIAYKVKRKCDRYGVKATTKWQSYMACCKNKVAFKGNMIEYSLSAC